MNAEAEEAAAEQKAILALFEMQRRDRAARELMAAERRAAAVRLAEDHAAARADAHRRNIKAARAAMAEADQRLFRADMTGGLATVAAERQRREHQYPLPLLRRISAARGGVLHLHLLPRGRRARQPRARVRGEPSPPWDGFRPPVR
jgi:hypothetical protein